MSRTPNMRRELLFQVVDVARAVRTYIDQCAREHGTTRAQWGVLTRLERQEGMTQAEMAESLEIQPISLVRLIDKLCKQGLVERRPHPRDRRANRLYLTDEGRTALTRLAPLGRQVATDILGSPDEAEISDLLQALLRLRSNIRRASGKRVAADGAAPKVRQELL